MTYNFASPVARLEVLVAESLAEHRFPFTLTRTSLAGPGDPLKTALGEAPKPSAQPVPVPPSAPVVLTQATPATEPAKPAAKEPAKLAPKEPEPKPAAEPTKEAPKPVAKRKPRAKPAATSEAKAPAAAQGQMAAAPAARVVTSPRFNDLVTAVLYRDPQAVNDLLALGKWPDRPDSRGMTPLMLAAMLGERPIAEVLLKAGADPSRSGPGGDTAMSLARERNDAGMVGLLQQYGRR